MSVAGDTVSHWIGGFRSWARRVGLDRKLAYMLVVVAVGSGMATVATMTEPSALATEPRTILILLYVDAALLFLLGIVVARQVIHVWIERRQGLAGSRLHIRLVVLFGLVAVTPAVLVAIFSGLFLNFGVQAWFSERVRTALNESVAVATAYLYEHQQNIRSDALAMANDLNRDAPFLIGKRARFDQVLTTMAALRSMPEALVVDGRAGCWPARRSAYPWNSASSRRPPSKMPAGVKPTSSPATRTTGCAPSSNWTGLLTPTSWLADSSSHACSGTSRAPNKR